MREWMLMEIHRNQEQSGIPYCPFYFGYADRGGPFDDDSADKHGPPYGFPT
jgi:hypothetical protein